MSPPPAADGSAPSLDGITPLIDNALALFGTFEIVITPATTTSGGANNADKLHYLAAKDRDFLAITPQLQDAAEASMSEAFTALFNESLDVTRCIPMLGEGVLDHIANRFEASTDIGPPDVSMQPLRPATTRRKGHAVIGIDSGDLARGIADATVTTRKVG